jgi:hypothetical protein
MRRARPAATPARPPGRRRTGAGRRDGARFPRHRGGRGGEARTGEATGHGACPRSACAPELRPPGPAGKDTAFAAGRRRADREAGRAPPRFILPSHRGMWRAREGRCRTDPAARSGGSMAARQRRRGASQRRCRAHGGPHGGRTAPPRPAGGAFPRQGSRAGGPFRHAGMGRRLPGHGLPPWRKREAGPGKGSRHGPLPDRPARRRPAGGAFPSGGIAASGPQPACPGRARGADAAPLRRTRPAEAARARPCGRQGPAARRRSAAAGRGRPGGRPGLSPHSEDDPAPRARARRALPERHRARRYPPTSCAWGAAAQ